MTIRAKVPSPRRIVLKLYRFVFINARKSHDSIVAWVRLRTGAEISAPVYEVNEYDVLLDVPTLAETLTFDNEISDARLIRVMHAAITAFKLSPKAFAVTVSRRSQRRLFTLHLTS